MQVGRQEERLSGRQTCLQGAGRQACSRKADKDADRETVS
jgi:hypothetical protein